MTINLPNLPPALVHALEAGAVGVAVLGLNALDKALIAYNPAIGNLATPLIVALAAYLNSLVGNPVGNAVEAFKAKFAKKPEVE